MTLDLDAYCARIGYAGGRSPTLETLRAVHIRHPEAIPFENLDPLLRRPVRLDIASLEHKLVRSGRGGYCYEHNLLFREVLVAFGFEVTGLAARVLWIAPEDALTPRTHMLLLLTLDGERYLADVGFGSMTLTAPLRFELETVQSTPHGPFRLIRTGDDFKLQAQLGEAWKTLYRFDLQPQIQLDYEVANWYVSTHPDSRFRTGLIAARIFEDRRYVLRNNDLGVHQPNGATERRTITSAAELRTTLESTFRITLPEGPELAAALQRITAS